MISCFLGRMLFHHIADFDTNNIDIMDKDIRDFLDRAEQKRLYEQKKKRKNKLLEKRRNQQERKSRKYAAQNGLDLLCGERFKGDSELHWLAENGRDYSKSNIIKVKRRKPKEQKELDWKNRPRFISVPMGGQPKKR